MKCFNKWLRKFFACKHSGIVILLILLSPMFFTKTLAVPGTPSGEQSAPEIYVPYRDLPELIDPANKAILMERKQFEDLLSASRELGEEGLKLGQITKAQYSTQIQEEIVTLTGKLEAVSMSKDPVMIPLAFGQLGLNRVTLDDKPAPLGYDRQGRLVLIVTSKGTHTLEVNANTKLQELASGGAQFSISIPEATAGTMTLTTPGDMEIHSTSPISETIYDKEADQTNIELTVGGQNKLTVILMGNGRREDDRAILLGESASTVKLSTTNQSLECLYTVQVLRRGVRQLQFQLPSEWTILQVTCPNLVRWSIDMDANSQEPQTLTVRLGSAKVGAVALSIQAAAPRENQNWRSPYVELVNADAERGYLMVNTDETLGVRGETLTSVRREDTSAAGLVTGLDANMGGRLYFHWGKGWSVNLDLEEVTLRRSIREQQKIAVSAQQVMLAGDFEVTAVERELFTMTFILRGLSDQWQIRDVLVNRQQNGFEYLEQTEGNRRLLRIELKQPVQPEKIVNVAIVLQNIPGNWDWPSNAGSRLISVPLIESQAETVSGYVSVSAQGDLDAAPENVPTMLEEIPVARMVALGMERQIQYAYNYNSPARGEIALEVSRRTPRQACDSIGLVDVKPEEFSGNWQITYTISRASDKKLYMLAHKSIGQEMLITSPTVQISSKSTVAADSLPFDVPDELAQNYDIWQLNLDSSILGNVVINTRYERPVTGNKFEVPLVRPLCEGQTSEHLAIQASEELALSINPVGAKEIDAIDLPPLPLQASRILAAYQLEPPSAIEGSNASLSLETSVHTTYQIPTALAVSADLTTYLDAQLRQQTEANFQIANASRQFLTFRLPQGAQLWSLSVNNRQAKPQRSTEGDYQVTLGRPGETVNVKIVYAYHPNDVSFDNAKLGGVDLLGLKINQLSWNVVPPPDYRITSQQTDMQTINITRQRPAFLNLYDYLKQFGFRGLVLPLFLQQSKKFESAGAFSSVSEKSGGGFAGAAEGEIEVRAGRVVKEPSAARTTTQRPRLNQREIRAQEEADRLYLRQQLELEQQNREQAGDILIQGDEARIPYADLVTYPQNARLPGRLIAEGRYTLPVNLVPTPGAGQFARFVGLGTGELIVGLTKQSKQRNYWIVGFLLIVTPGIALLMKKAKLSIAFLSGILLAVSFIAVWWPSITSFTNGIFWGTLILIAITIIIPIIRWFLIRTGWIAGNNSVTTVVMLILCLMLTVTSVSAQGTDTASGTQNSEQIIVPYDTTPEKADTSEKVLVPYSRFVELWNRVHPEEPIDLPAPGTEVSLADVRYNVTITKEQLNMILTTEIQTFGKSWITLGLPVSGLAITEALFNGKNAQLQSSQNGMFLMLPGDSSGTLQIKALAKPEYLGQMGSIKFSLPPLPAAVMDLVLPQTDLELEVDGIESFRQSTGSANWRVALGMTRELNMRWLPRLGGSQVSGALSANSEHDVYAFHWAMIGVSKITYAFAGGERDRFSILVPQNVTLTDVSGTNIRDYRQSGQSTIDGNTFNIIEARLHRPAKKQYELNVKWLSEIPPLDKAEELQLVRAGDVGRESGTVTLYAAGGMGIKVSEIKGGRRTTINTNTSALQNAARNTQNESSDRAKAVSSYYWPYRPFSLSIELSRLETVPKVSMDQLVRINNDLIELLVQAKFTSEQGELFDASFALPENYELLSVVGPSVKNYYERSNDNGNFVHVEFSSGQRETTAAFVLVQNNAPPEDFNVPTIKYIDPTRPLQSSIDHEAPEQEGRLAIQLGASFDAQTISSENLTGITPEGLRDWLNPQQCGLVQFAYRCEEPNPSLRLNIRKKPTEIHSEVFAGLVIKPTSASYTYRLRYNISGSPVERLGFSMPSQYAPLAAVTAGGGLRSLTRNDSNDGTTSWTISLLNEVTGIVDIAVNFALPIESSTTELSIPSIETESPEGQQSFVAVQNMSRHEIRIQDSNNLTVLPLSRQQSLMPARMRESLQYVYQSFEPDWRLSLALTQAKPAARIQAVVDLLALTTVINRDGRCRYEVRVELQNRSEQFLQVQAPQGLNLWSARVAGQPVKPVRDANAPAGVVLIPLVKTSPGGLPYDIVLYFADEGDKPLVSPLKGISRLKPPGITIIGVPVARTTWSLRLPGDFSYVRPGGNMSRVAGIAEQLIIDNEARLEQFNRLDQSYRDLAVKGKSEQIQDAKSNYDAFNKKLASGLQETEKYILSNSSAMSPEEYERLRSSVRDLQQRQSQVIEGNIIFLERQREQLRNDMNAFLNGTISNTGVAETARNSEMNQMPTFVGRNERQQVERLNKELQESQETMLNYQNISNTPVPLQKPETKSVQQQGKAPAELILKDSDKQAEMGELLEALSEKADSSIVQRQQQLQEQLSQMSSNRLQRYADSRGQVALNAEAQQRPVATPSTEPTQDRFTTGQIPGGGFGGRGGSRGARGGFGGGLRADQSQTTTTRGRTSGPQNTLGASRGQATSSDIALDDYTQQVPGYDVNWRAGPGLISQPYAAQNIYSLPVSLPSGSEVQLDFARSSGDAQLSVWAVPVGTIRNLVTTLVITLLAILVYAIVRLWPRRFRRDTKRPVSKELVLIYISLIVILSVLFGALGLTASLILILLNETVGSVRRA